MKFNRISKIKFYKYISSYIKLAFSVAVLFFLTACTGTGGKLVFTSTHTINGGSVSSKPSNDRIDNENTYEVFFRLEKDIECIRFTSSASVLVDKFKNTRSPVDTYLIVDQSIDISKFKGVEKKYIFSQIGKNFDDQFIGTKFLTICPQKGNPLFSLGKNKLYRIRFTTFKPGHFEYKLSIFSNCKIFFVKGDSGE